MSYFDDWGPLEWVCVGVMATAVSCAYAPADAGGIVDVAKCTIEANERLPVGPELTKAERKCYDILPKRVAKRAYEHRPSLEDRVIVEERLNGVQAAQPAPRYYPTLVPQQAAPVLRYPYPYGPAPAYQAPYIYRTTP